MRIEFRTTGELGTLVIEHVRSTGHTEYMLNDDVGYEHGVQCMLCEMLWRGPPPDVAISFEARKVGLAKFIQTALEGRECCNGTLGCLGRGEKHACPVNEPLMDIDPVGPPLVMRFSDAVSGASFKVGDIVVLKSGGPKMVVNAGPVNVASGGSNAAPARAFYCAWITKTDWRPFEHLFHASCLKLYEVPPVTRARVSPMAWAPGVHDPQED